MSDKLSPVPDVQHDQIQRNIPEPLNLLALQKLQTASDNDTTSSTVRSVCTDVLAVGLGLATKYGVNKLLARGPVWMKPAGLLLGAVAAGFSKDLLADGELGNAEDWARGVTLYGGATLVQNSFSRGSLTPQTRISRQVSQGVTTSDTARFIAGYENAGVQRALLADRGTSAGARLAEYTRPLNYVGISYDNGLRGVSNSPLAYCVAIQPSYRFAGWGGASSAKMLAEGSIGLAEFNARTHIGQFATRFAGGYALGASKEAILISTGHGGKTNDVASIAKQINSSGFRWGAVTAVAGSGATALGSKFRVLR